MEFDWKKLKRLRKEKGIKQGDFARLIGTKQANVSRYEAGLVEPRLKMMYKIAKVLGVDMMELTTTEANDGTTAESPGRS